MVSQTESTVALTMATPAILPPMISGTEADERRTSRILLLFSSMMLLSSMPAPLMITIHRSMPMAKPVRPGMRSLIDTLPAAALGEKAANGGSRPLIRAITAGARPAASSRWRRSVSRTAAWTAHSSVRSPMLRDQSATATVSSLGVITTAASSRPPSAVRRSPMR